MKKVAIGSLFLSVLVGCSSGSGTYATDYVETLPYYSSLDTSKPVVETGKCSIDLEKVVSKEAELVRERFPNYPFYWDKLDKVDIKFATKYVSPRTGKEMSSICTGIYNPSENTIYIFDEDEIEMTVAHELGHVLTTNEVVVRYNFAEGVSEYIARNSYNNGDHVFKYETIYEADDNFVEMCCAIFGEEVALEILLDGSIVDVIDNYTENGFGTKVVSALKESKNTKKYEGIRYLKKVIQDIMVQVAINYSYENNFSDAEKDALKQSLKTMLEEDNYLQELADKI